MIALRLLPIVQLLLILLTHLAWAYPSTYYSSKRYRQAHRPASFDPYYTRNQRYPLVYYPSYSQLYPEDYYYLQDAYSPIYYMSPRTTKYDYYQSSLPFYYRSQEAPASRTKPTYYNYPDQAIEDPEKLLQDYEREQRERSQPIGHEIRYESDYSPDDDPSMDETSAAFLNNLMMQQMYQDAQLPSSYNDYSSSTSWNEDRPVKLEDEEVEELKELPRKQRERKTRQRKQRKQRINNDTPSKRSESSSVVFTDRKPVVTESLEEATRRDTRGQKEEVLMRPATPVRHPFSDSVLEMMNRQEERKRSPSVYDQIKQMLQMEKNEEKQSIDPDVRQSMKKRIVSSEDTLTRQLSVLKKTQ